MISRVMSAELAEHAGQRVTIAGWVHRRRQLKSVSFLVVRDRTGLAQVVAAGDLPPEESVVQVTGTVTDNPQAPGGFELVAPEVEVLTQHWAAPPIDLYRPVVGAALPTLLDHAPVTLRHPMLRAPLEISAASVAGFRETLDRQGFTEIHTPKIVASATESGANVFGIDYFGRPAFLAQSPQFYKQAMVGVFERVYEVGPVFRAEPHDTVRHLAQYTSLDAELGFIQDHRDVMAVLREVLAGMIESVRHRAAPALDLLGLALPEVPDEIPVVHFTDAQELTSSDEPDLAPAQERWLSEWAEKEHGSEFLFVTGYPLSKRPFYTHPDPARAGYSNGFDLLFRGMELVTGGQRLHRYPDYLAALGNRNEEPGPYRGYLQAFRQGMPPHGGFALGLERWTARLTGAANIRQVTAFPRDLNRLSP
ncbi:nondiscriminating aspartyl-tRNA synthetase [Nonomuraea solani]|uniref:Aspartate--tRNA(Asp/Asn) ligase n=1 Tax=Nonomuraea solani TaxID=1144553 RepID=A0A1H6DCD7_9ACTN|nr:aspartate--tRNA(Asn) ligase [Nonomuraea solani]SEG82854.1 nondiscriminating aspartyl-tRNA synthetase [Nonomuraea solani]